MLNHQEWVEYTCDRCGAVETANDGSYSSMPSGWMLFEETFEKRRDLCPNCAEQYSAMIKAFWDGPVSALTTSSPLHSDPAPSPGSDAPKPHEGSPAH